MFWANFLHFYQPPTQKKEILDRVVRECYRPVFAGLLKIPQARLTINFSSCLAELLARYGHADILGMVRELLEKGQIELTGSAKYHPLLPKMPESEIIRQIKMDLETNEKYFGPDFAKATAGKGFFPPEMAFDLRLAQIVNSLGFSWVIADEYSFPGQCQWNKIYRIKDSSLGIYFRERSISFKILSAQLGTAKMLVNELGGEFASGRYLLTAMDGETFGHHRPGLEELLFEVYRSDKLQGLKISDLPQYFPVEEVIPLPSTWALMKQDQERQIPFARWDDPDNEIHQWQWRLTDLAIKSGSGLGDDTSCRQLLDRALHSDQYWWASAKPWWSIEYIEMGSKELLEVVKASPLASDKEIKEAENLYLKILTAAFDWQRTGRVSQMAKEEDEEIYQRSKKEEAKIDKEEIKKMIKKLAEQKLSCVKHEEYERAAQLRERIKELQWYLK